MRTASPNQRRLGEGGVAIIRRTGSQVKTHRANEKALLSKRPSGGAIDRICLPIDATAQPSTVFPLLRPQRGHGRCASTGRGGTSARIAFGRDDAIWCSLPRDTVGLAVHPAVKRSDPRCAMGRETRLGPRWQLGGSGAVIRCAAGRSLESTVLTHRCSSGGSSRERLPYCERTAVASGCTPAGIHPSRPRSQASALGGHT